MARIDLAANYPLPAPLVLFVEPTNVCNFRCGICPESFPDYQQQVGYYQHMNDLTWQRIWEGLAAWKTKPVVRFYHVGEPLLNRNLPRMILAAAGLGCRTELTTNASLLDPHRADELLKSGLDYLRVSVYGTTDAVYERETGKPSNLWRVIGNVMELRLKRAELGYAWPHIHAELVTSEPDDEERFRGQWKAIADSMTVKALHNWGASLVQLGQPASKMVCPFPFYELAIKANGDVTVCCVDWDAKLSVGNVNLQSLQEIWEGPRLTELQRVHMAGERRKLLACRDCNVLNACPDNVDSLLPVIQSAHG